MVHLVNLAQGYPFMKVIEHYLEMSSRIVG